MLCVLIFYISDGTYSLKSTPNDRFLETFHGNLRVFARNLLRGRRNIFSYLILLEICSLGPNEPTHYYLFTLRIFARNLVIGLRNIFSYLILLEKCSLGSNEPTHYLLNYGDFPCSMDILLALINVVFST